ncbi:hypothetical protein D3C76_1333900 [compost metagenome]
MSQTIDAARAICKPEIAIRCNVPVSRISFLTSCVTANRSPIPSPRITVPHVYWVSVVVSEERYCARKPQLASNTSAWVNRPVNG